MLQHTPLILKNSWRNRRRTVLTILSIGASLCLLGVLMAVFQAFYMAKPSESDALRLVTRNKVSLVFPMPEFYRDKIKQIPGVREAVISDWYGGTYKDKKPENQFARFGAEPDRLLAVHPEFQMSEDEKKAFLADRAGCIVGNELANKMKWKVGDRLTLQGDIYPGNLELTIRGVYSGATNNDVLYFNRKYVQEGLPERRKGQAGIVTILAASAEDVPRIESAVDTLFANAPVATKTETESAFGLSFISFLGNVKAFLLIVSSAVTFTILLVSANTIAMSVRERVREVGVLKVLGFTNPTVLFLILGEAIVISAVGGVLGAFLASGLAFMLRQGPNYLQQLHTLQIEPAVWVLCVIVAAVIGAVSALLPAFQASRMPILTALRSTD